MREFGSSLPARGRSAGRVAGPLVPRAVVVGQVAVAESGQVEEDDGGGDAPVAVGDRRLVGHDAAFEHSLADGLERQEAPSGSKKSSRGTWVAPGMWPPRGPRLAPVYWPASRASRSWRPELAEAGEDRRPWPATRAGDAERTGRWGTATGPGSDRTFFVDPAVPAAVEDAHGVMAVVGQGPPEAGGELAPMWSTAITWVESLIRLGHDLGESGRGSDLGGTGSSGSIISSVQST